jgi:hypothetical protein
MIKNPKLTGNKLLRATMNYIIQHPEEWNQRCEVHPCFTTCCFVGRAVLLAGQSQEEAARCCNFADFKRLVKLPASVRNELYGSRNTMADLYEMVVAITGSRRGLLPLPKSQTKRRTTLARD